jgi:hypothetical protein
MLKGQSIKSRQLLRQMTPRGAAILRLDIMCKSVFETAADHVDHGIVAGTAAQGT